MITPYSYIIVDDNPVSANKVHLAMERHTDFSCLGALTSADRGLYKILEFAPTLVFWNIKVSKISSEIAAFYFVKEIQSKLRQAPAFVILADTAKYAIEGIRHNVLDYILQEDLGSGSVERAVQSFRALSPEVETQSTLCLKSYGDYKFINTNEVLFLKADSNTTDIMRANGQTINAFKTLKHFQELLPDHFIRVHNSYIVNSRYISRIHFGKALCTIKHSDVAVPFSKSYRTNVERIRDILSTDSVVIS